MYLHNINLCTADFYRQMMMINTTFKYKCTYMMYTE